MIIDKHYILIAEGITDCSFLEAILEQYLGFVQYQNVKELPLLFAEMIGKYPTITGELQRQDSPTFYYKDNIGVAVKQANGCSRIPIVISSLANLIDKLELYDTFDGFLIFCDTDLNSKEEIKKNFSKQFQENEIYYENDSIKLYGNQMLCKLYLFPTIGNGAIEKLLLECTNVSYRSLYQDSQEYRNRIMSEEYQELREKCWAKKKTIQEFYADKVQFGSISTVLKPDKPVRFAIKDKLIRFDYFDLYMNLTEFKELHNFLQINLV